MPQAAGAPAPPLSTEAVQVPAAAVPAGQALAPKPRVRLSRAKDKKKSADPLLDSDVDAAALIGIDRAMNKMRESVQVNPLCIKSFK